jgi:hypothetical protein
VSPAPGAPSQSDRRPGRPPSAASRGCGYHRNVLGLLMLMVVALVWLKRRLTLRRERLSAAEEARAEVERLAREQAIIAEMEADFLKG